MKELEFPRIGERCYYDTLPNGLPVYVLPKPGFSKSFAFFAVHYGGNDTHFRVGERWHQTPAGVAHYLEHKMFDMPEGNALQVMSERGASVNAFTGADMTGYYFSCTDLVYENLRDLLRFVTTPYFTEESVAKEQGIIGQEIRMIEDDPDWQIYHHLMQALYTGHPIRNGVAGSVESIAAITPEILESCHKTFYQASNMVLCVAGSVDPREVFRIAAAIVPADEKRTIWRDHGEAETLESAEQETIMEMEVSAPNFLLGFKTEPDSSLRSKLVGELAAELLAGESSPLYAKLYQAGLINKTFGLDFESNGETAHFVFGGESSNPAAVTEAILNEGVRIAWNGLDEAAFRRARRAEYGARVRALNSFDHLCIQIAKGHFAGYQYLDFAALYDQITRQEVEELLRESITGTRSALSIVNPKGV